MDGFTNSGCWTIEVSGTGETNTGMENSGTIYNLGTGKITLTSAKDIGWLNSEAGIFINSGNLLIDKVVQRYGVVNVANTGYFANHLGGDHPHQKCLGITAFRTFNGFYNSGKLTIQAAGTDAIFNEADGFFFIQPCGELNVENRINNKTLFPKRGPFPVNL
ncbi:MAG: hypothetical protein IPM82_26490 [Saprospiraceae bacterium]|nr:hypothetical protein [Saprospiraceae bacterium]